MSEKDKNQKAEEDDDGLDDLLDSNWAYFNSNAFDYIILYDFRCTEGL